MCRLVRCYAKDKARILLVCERSGIHMTIAAAFEKLGAQQLHGLAPPGALERTLAELLEDTEV